MQRLLTQEQDQLLRQERDLLEELRVHLARLDAAEEDLALLKRSLQQMDEFFLLVVVGEFNAGKTAFLNALLGSRLLQEGVTPTTDNIHVLRYGESFNQQPNGDDYLLIQVPVDWLREVSLVDTPGTNAVIQRHQQITEHFVPRSDLVLFVTSADRPFSESERTFLEHIRQWGKKIVIIVNKIDLMPEAADRQQILDFVRTNARNLLGVEPQIFAVSTRLALQAKQDAKTAAPLVADSVFTSGHPPIDSELWAASQFGPLEHFITEQLDATERLRLKLENPLGIATRLLDRYQQVIDNRLELLKGDVQTLDVIDEQVAAYESDMRRDFKYQLSHVDNILYEMAERGDRFFDESMRLGRIFDLINSAKLRGDFEREVIANTGRQIESQVSELIDWIVDKDYAQWRAVMEYLNRRAKQHSEQMVGEVGSNFESTRQNLLASVGREAQHVVDSYDREAESLKLVQEVQRAIIQTAAVEVGALGLGALLVVLMHTTLLDFTGVLGASAIAALGLYVLPYRRAKIKTDLRERIGQLREQLNTAMSRQFEKEMSDSIQRLREAIAPYTRFVRVERDKLEQLDNSLQTVETQVAQIRSTVKKLV
ncbi:MAG: dynamin family protein [Chloroflexi bacterium]|nr:dynamin family protein [Chloroflexota bacterium]